MKKFNEWLQLREMFMHPSSVPVNFAMAVYRVMHNQATQEDWDLLDGSVSTAGIKWVLKAIQDILRSNNVPEEQISKEVRWFQKELVGYLGGDQPN